MKTTISNSLLEVEINHFGAELCSIKKNTKEYIWEGNPAIWGKHSPVLFPIVGTLKNNSYTYNAIEYHLPRHGFARDLNFNLIDKATDSATFSIHSTETTLEIYPFEFEFQIKYTLESNQLAIQFIVINKGDSKMPFSIGAHPAFALPNNFEDYSIQFDTKEILEYNLLENDLISNKTALLENQNGNVKLNYSLFENDALIFKSLQSNSITIFENSSPFLKVGFENFPHLGIWTKINAPFICIEPWFGYSDTAESNGNLFEKEGIQIVDAKAIFESKYTIEIL